MGIEKISGQAGFQAQAAQAVQTNKVNVQPVSESELSQDMVNSASNTAAVMQISSSQKANTDENNGADTSAKQQEEQEEQKEASIRKLKDIQKVINDNTVAEFGYNEPTNRITIKIKDKETDEVIKEIPSEKALEMLAKAWELAGILVDEKR